MDLLRCNFQMPGVEAHPEAAWEYPAIRPFRKVTCPRHEHGFM